MKGRQATGGTGAKLTAILLVAAVTLAVTSCGGSDDSGSDDTAADEAAVESLLLDYAALVGEEGCALWSQDLLARKGGIKGCVDDIGSEVVTTIKVDDVEIEGDTGEVLVTVLPDEEQFRYPVVRDGDSTQSYDGWRIAEIDVEEVTAESDATSADTAEATTAETSTTAPTEETTDQSLPPISAGPAGAYLACIEGRGAENVKHVGVVGKEDALPSVDFSGGGSRVNAVFGTSQEDAKQGLATVKQRDPFFAQRFGTIVLYSVGDPLADNLDIGIGCAEEAG